MCAGSFLIKSVTESFRHDYGEEEIIEGTIRCSSGCSDVRISRAIPRFVDNQNSSSEDILSGKKFAQSWKRFPRLDPIYWDQFFRWIAPVTSNFVKDKTVLELGCGKGRHTEILQQCGAQAIVAVDIGDSVDVAYQNVGHLPDVHIIQADIMCLPVKPCFDYSLSVGVLHHMAAPIEGFKALLNKTKPEGNVSAWVYGRENNAWIIYFVNPLRIFFTSKLPESFVKLLSVILACILYLVVKAVYVPWSKLQSNESSAVPKLFYQDYLVAISRYDFNEMFSIVFDHLIAPTAFYLSEGELKHWLKDPRIEGSILRFHNGNSWSIFASRNDLVLEDPKVKDTQKQLIGSSL